VVDHIRGDIVIYFDYAATTPMSETALTVYQKAAQLYFGNTMSMHDIGTDADELVTKARGQLGSIINAPSNGLYFTNGGSDGNFLAIVSLAMAHADKGKHIISSPIEHSSVLNTLEYLENLGFTLSFLPVDQFGKVSISELVELIREDTILVSIGHGNSEIGTIQPIEEIGQLLEPRKILFHSDCVQTFGKIPIDVQKAKLSSITISSHKIYGPKGIGACYINPLFQWSPILPNETHEKGFRPGTLDVPAIVAFSTAAYEYTELQQSYEQSFLELRNLFISGIIKKEIPVQFEGDPNNFLPNIIGLRIKGIEGQYIMLECNRYGIAISTGSACRVGQSQPSNTMIATGKKESEAYEFIRVSLGKNTTSDEVEQLVNTLVNITEQYFNNKTSDKNGSVSL
jgi:cysteine desulfurase